MYYTYFKREFDKKRGNCGVLARFVLILAGMMDEDVCAADSAFRAELMRKETALKSIMGKYYAKRMKDDGIFKEEMTNASEFFGLKHIRTIDRLEWDYRRRLGNIVLKKVKYIQENTYKYNRTKKRKANDKSIKRHIAVSDNKIGRELLNFFGSVFDLFLPETQAYSNRLREIEREMKGEKEKEDREAETVKDRVTEQLVKLDEKLKKLTRMRLEDEITRESYFEFKSEIEKEKLDLLSKRRVLDAGMVPNGNPEDPAKKAEDFLLAKMDFTDHRIDRDVIGQFVGTIVPVTETCFNWYMNFDLADKSDDMKRLVWEFTIDYKEAKSYRKERDGMLRQNQWHDLTVRVFM